MSFDIIVQARLSSSRFPKKIIQDLNGKPVLSHVLERCGQVQNVRQVICAIADEEGSEQLVSIAGDSGAKSYIGDVDDVLARYYHAARTYDCQHIMRVTSDCPLIDPQICGDVVQHYFQGKFDYCCNNNPRSFPHGLDCEIFSFSLLEEAFKDAKTAYEREHVTPYMRMHQDISKGNIKATDALYANERWTLDYKEDLEFFRALYSENQGRALSSLKDVLQIIKKSPHVRDINQHYAV